MNSALPLGLRLMLRYRMVLLVSWRRRSAAVFQSRCSSGVLRNWATCSVNLFIVAWDLWG